MILEALAESARILHESLAGMTEEVVVELEVADADGGIEVAVMVVGFDKN
jgi:hypothetical protein